MVTHSAIVKSESARHALAKRLDAVVAAVVGTAMALGVIPMAIVVALAAPAADVIAAAGTIVTKSVLF
jgi:hypothetical protein